MRVILIILLNLQLFYGFSQKEDLYGCWEMASREGFDLILNENGFSIIYSEEYATLKYKDSILVIRVHPRPKLWWLIKEKYYFDILRLDDTKLIISKNPRSKPFETFPDEKILEFNKIICR
jgi:hypothetical protein